MEAYPPVSFTDLDLLADSHNHTLQWVCLQKVDAFACGVTLCQMLKGPRCFDEIRKSTDIQTLENDFRAEFQGFSDDCQKFLLRMLNPDPETRLSISQAMKHPWFRKNLPKNYHEYNSLLMHEQGRKTACHPDYGQLVELAHAFRSAD